LTSLNQPGKYKNFGVRKQFFETTFHSFVKTAPNIEVFSLTFLKRLTQVSTSNKITDNTTTFLIV